MLIPFFKAGTHTSSNKQVITYTKAELEKRAAAYNSHVADYQAPLVVGHPKQDAPRFGSVTRLDVIGDLLVASADKVNAEFRASLDAGNYPHVSASWNTDGSLNHIGFLGGVAPAIKGLPTFSYSESEEAETFEFSTTELATDVLFSLSWIVDSIRRSFQGLRDFTIEEKGVDVADKFLPTWTIDSIRFTPPENDITSTFSQVQDTIMSTDKDAQAALLAQTAEIESLKAQLLAKDAEAATAKRNAEYCAVLDSEEFRGVVTPALRPMLMTIATELGNKQTVEYSVGDGEEAKTVSGTPVEFLKSLLKNIGPNVEYSEVAVNGVTPPPSKNLSDDIAERANKNSGR